MYDWDENSNSKEPCRYSQKMIRIVWIRIDWIRIEWIRIDNMLNFSLAKKLS